MSNAKASRNLETADIEISPLNAALAALLDTPIPETLFSVCDALAIVADVGDEFRAAVDRAQNLATACGLVQTLTQDAIQAIMAQSFKGCRVHQRSPAEPLPPVRTRAAESTVEALMFSLRERGTAALLDRDCRRRLADMSTTQIRGVIARLIVLRPRCPSITDDLLYKLGQQL